MEFIVSTKPPYVYNYYIISVLNKSNPDICPQIYLQHLPNDTVLPFCDSCLRHGSSRSHWSTPNAHLGKRWFVWDIEDGKKIDTCGLPIYYIHILRKVWDSSFSVCVCVCRETSQAGQLHVSILATRHLRCFYTNLYIYIHIYMYINVTMYICYLCQFGMFLEVFTKYWETGCVNTLPLWPSPDTGGVNG